MRLGAWNCELTNDSRAARAYQSKIISERHRHRYEFNNKYLDRVFDDQFIIAGTNPETGLVEIVENKNHPWFVGVQFHPEYKSTVSNPHPLFVDFVKASLAQKSK
jgi:CTP synthase